MNNDDLTDGARVVALTAIVNLLLREIGRTGIARVQNDLVPEITRIADGDAAIRSAALDYIDKAMTELK